jgi:hypothetical protein
MHLYKYTASRYVESFQNGEVRFLPLSYYQQHEANLAVGDPDEAMRLFRPTAGLEVNNLTTGKAFLLPATFVSTAVAEDVFVFCLSRSLDRSLAQEFGYDSCVEITNVETFIQRIARAVAVEHNANRLLHGPVSYYREPDPPGVAWALPDAIVMSKRAFYERQAEYRFAFGRRDVLDVGRTAQQLPLGDVPRREGRPGLPRILQIGEIRSISRTHEWGSP